MPSMDELQRKAKWNFSYPLRLHQRVRYNDRILRKRIPHRKHNINNFRKFPFFYMAYEPRWIREIDLKDIKDIRDFDRWVERRLPIGVPDGWYSLLGYDVKKMYKASLKRQVPRIRWIAHFRVSDGHIADHIKRAKGKPFGRKHEVDGTTTRPQRYFGIWLYLAQVKKK